MVKSPIRAMLIYNPKAGQIWSAFRPDTVEAFLARHDWQVTSCPTEYAGSGSALARRAVSEGFDIVIGAGGDGTLNEIVQSLAYTPLKMGILPVGTTNVLARELHIPLSFQEALEQLPVARPINLDLGKLTHKRDARYFLLMAGIGYDAEVVSNINLPLKAFAGKTAVVTSGLFNLITHRPFGVRMRLTDSFGKRLKLRKKVMQIMVSNAATYATDYKIAEQARMDDGLLELHLFKSKRFLDTLMNLLSLVLRRHKEWTDFEHYSLRVLQIHGSKAIQVQIDGDTICRLPVQIEVAPKALTVLAPK
jgi:YegS/Rv2252/BmrU family lipid kinase